MSDRKKNKGFLPVESLVEDFSHVEQAMSALQGPVLGRLQSHVHSRMREHAEMPPAGGVVLWGTSLRRGPPRLTEKEIRFCLSQEIKGTVVQEGDPTPQ